MMFSWFKRWFQKKEIKTDVHCVIEGCMNLKAAGQTYVCAKHVRTN